MQSDLEQRGGRGLKYKLIFISANSAVIKHFYLNIVFAVLKRTDLLYKYLQFFCTENNLQAKVFIHRNVFALIRKGKSLNVMKVSMWWRNPNPNDF